MRRYPNHVNAYLLARGAFNDTQAEIKGMGWMIARPHGWPSLLNRVRLAWLVFTGRCDALYWPGQEQ